MTDKKVIKKMYQLLLTEPHAPTLCDQLENIAREALAQPEQEPVAFEEWLAKQHGDPEEIGFLQALRIAYLADQDSITTPPQRTWIGLEGAEFGWFCYTDFLNARKYTKKQRQLICCQILSEAQSWDIGNYQLMMHDSTKLKENT